MLASLRSALGWKVKKNGDEYAKSGDKPDDIPADPAGVYKGEGWNGFEGDWLKPKIDCDTLMRPVRLRSALD